MSNIIDLSKASNRADLLTPLQLLESELEDFKSGREWISNANKAMVIYLDDRNNGWSTRLSQSGMKVSECIALLESLKQSCLDQLLGKDGHG